MVRLVAQERGRRTARHVGIALLLLVLCAAVAYRSLEFAAGYGYGGRGGAGALGGGSSSGSSRSSSSSGGGRQRGAAPPTTAASRDDAASYLAGWTPPSEGEISRRCAATKGGWCGAFLRQTPTSWRPPPQGDRDCLWQCESRRGPAAAVLVPGGSAHVGGGAGRQLALGCHVGRRLPAGPPAASFAPRLKWLCQCEQVVVGAEGGGGWVVVGNRW